MCKNIWTQIQLCYKWFKEGRYVINDATPMQSMKTLKQWRKLLDNRRIIIIEITDDVVISFSWCQAIFTHVFGMKGAAANTVQKLLHFEQKQCRMDIGQEMLAMFDYIETTAQLAKTE